MCGNACARPSSGNIWHALHPTSSNTQPIAGPSDYSTEGAAVIVQPEGYLDAVGECPQLILAKQRLAAAPALPHP
eukprot:6187603-Prymnesium_polylepis.1